MFTRKSISSMITIIVFLSMVLGVAAAPTAVQAQGADPTLLMIDPTSVDIPPLSGYSAIFTFTNDYKGYGSYPANIAIDTRVTISSDAGVNLAGMVIHAYNMSNGEIGTITLSPGVTSFWSSAFGGILARKKARDIKTETIVSYKLSLIPTTSLEGKTITVTGQTLIGENKLLNSYKDGGTYNWRDYSDLKTAKAYVVQLPELVSAEHIGGPYKLGDPKTFNIVISNPSNGINFSTIRLNFTISPADGVLPIVGSFKFGMNGTADTSGSFATTSDGLLQALLPVAGGLNKGETKTITVQLQISGPNLDKQYPGNLSLEDVSNPSLPATLDTYPAVLAVNTQDFTLSADAMAGTYITGIPRIFNVTVINPETGGVYKSLTLGFKLVNGMSADVSALQYFNTTTQEWSQVSSNGDSSWTYHFPMGLNANDSATIKFRITFVTPGFFDVNLSLIGELVSGGTRSPETQVEKIKVVPPAMLGLTNFNQNIYIGQEQTFTLSVYNLNSGTNYLNWGVNFTITDLDQTNIAQVVQKLDCSFNGGGASSVTLTVKGSTVSGSLPLPNLPLNAGDLFNYQCTMKLGTEGYYLFTYNFVDLSAPNTPIYSLPVTSTIEPMPFIYLPIVRG